MTAPRRRGSRSPSCALQHIMPHPARLSVIPDPRLALPAQPVTLFDGALRELVKDCWKPCTPRRGSESQHRTSASPAGGGARPRPVDGARTYGPIRRSSGHRPRRSRIRKAASRCPASMTHQASCARPDQFSRRRRQSTDRGVAGSCARFATSMRIDQLNGLFWIQRLSRLKRERLIKEV